MPWGRTSLDCALPRPAIATSRASLAALCLVAAALSPRPARAIQLPEERIATADPLYLDLERLATRFGQQPRFLSSRPLRRAEASGFLDSLATRHPEAAQDPAYRRALRTLRPDAPGGKPALVHATGDGNETVEISAYLAALYADDIRNRPDVDRDYRGGLTLAATPDPTWVVSVDLYAGTSSQGGRGTPRLGTSNALVEGVDFNTWMGEAYVEGHLGALRALAGHSWLRWGPGREGTLALSDAAPALDMLRAEITMFSAWRFTWFVALLDPGPQTYLAGHRLEWSRGGVLTAGLTEMARFDGNSQAPLYLMPLVPYSYWEKRRKTSPDYAVPGDTTGIALGKNNTLYATDVSWSPRPGWRAWGEFLMDDFSFSNDYKPDMIGYQAGLERRLALGAPDAGRALEAALEYTRVHNFTYSVDHGHDFALQGFPLGFVLGPDVASLAGDLVYEHGPAWEFGLRGEWRRKGEGAVGHPWIRGTGPVDASQLSGVVTRETRVSGSLIYSPTRQMRVEGTLGRSDIANEDHVAGRSSSSWPFALRTTLAW